MMNDEYKILLTLEENGEYIQFSSNDSYDGSDPQQSLRDKIRALIINGRICNISLIGSPSEKTVPVSEIEKFIEIIELASPDADAAIPSEYIKKYMHNLIGKAESPE